MTLKSIASRDLGKFAENTYGGSGVTRKVVKRESLDLMGQDAYRTRWQISDRSETLGFLESVAFASPHEDGSILILRMGSDAASEAPSIEFTELILKRIQEVPRTDRGYEGTTI